MIALPTSCSRNFCSYDIIVCILDSDGACRECALADTYLHRTKHISFYHKICHAMLIVILSTYHRHSRRIVCCYTGTLMGNAKFQGCALNLFRYIKERTCLIVEYGREVVSRFIYWST